MLAGLIAFWPQWAYPAQADQRPRIGLVLGGGSARGLAHIGVLHWLEENRIPVDLVVGASMGGLVGGIYATGWTPDEIQALLENLDWDELLRASPPYRHLTYRRKEDASAYTTRFELGWRNGLAPPAGLNAGHFIGLLLDRLAIPYHDLKDFDELPIPFRCVATDLEKGEPVVFDQGPFNVALRATMAIPGVFSPVEHEGRLLVDGGVLNNVPADLARQFGAEIVIAVDVGSPLRERDKLRSLVGVADQTLNILILENVRRSIRHADVLLAPDLGERSSLDFQNIQELISSGYQAAASRGVMLRTLSVSEPEWQKHLQARRARIRTQVPVVDRVSVEGTAPRQTPRISAALGIRRGQPIDLETLENTLTGIYGEGRTDAVGYQVVDRQGANELHVSVKEKGFDPPFFRFGLHIDGSEVDDVGFVLRSRTTFFDLGKPGSETRVDLDLGSPLGVAAEHYIPATGRWFLATSGFAGRRSSSFFVGEERAAEYLETGSGGAFDLGYGFGLRQDEVRLGLSLSHVDARVRVGDPSLFPALVGTLGSARLRWIHNGLDEPTVPRQGHRWKVEALQYLETPSGVPRGRQFSMDFASFQPMFRQGRVFVRAEAATSFDTNLPPALAFSLGGPLRLGAYGQGQLRGSRLVFSSVGYLHELGETPGLLGTRIYIGGWYEGGSAWNRGDPRLWRHLGSAGLVLDSVLGPVFVGSSWGEGGRYRFYFSVGFVF